MLTEWLMVVLGIVLTAGTAIFVAAEFSLVALDPSLINDDLKDRRLASVRKALSTLSTQLSGAQVGITLTTILLGYTTQPALSRLFSGWFEEAAWLSTAAAMGLATAVSMVLVNLFSMLFGELVPKNMALADPLHSARLVAPLQRGFSTVLRPVIRVLNGSANALLRAFGVEPREELSGARTPQELSSLVRRSAEAGTLEVGMARLLTRSIALGELTAIDVMTDRTRLRTVRRDTSAADIVEAARQTGHSRFPVIDQTADDVVGLVSLRKAIAVPYARRSDVPAAALMDDAPRVPETVGLGPLLVELRDVGMQMAVVVDEYGGTSGVVTLEDVVEELVGAVSDEHDVQSADAYVLSDTSWSVAGTMRPDELTARTGAAVPESRAYETVAGLVMAELGRVAEVGDQVEIPGLILRVDRMSGRRIERVRVTVVPVADEGEERR